MKWLVPYLLLTSAALAQVGLSGSIERSNLYPQWAMAASVCKGTACGEGADVTTAATTNFGNVAIPAGSLLIVAVLDLSPVSPAGSMADDAGDTFHAGPSVSIAGSSAKGFVKLFYAYNATGGAAGSITFTYTLAQANHSAMFTVFYFEFVKSSADPLDVSGTNSGTGTTASVSFSATPINGDLLFGYNAANLNSAPCCTNILTESWNNVDSGGLIAGGGFLTFAAQITNDGNIGSHATGFDASYDWGGLVASFKHQ